MVPIDRPLGEFASHCIGLPTHVTADVSAAPSTVACGGPPARRSRERHADGMPARVSPVDVRALLREEVGRLRERESRRVFDAAVQVGVLAGPRDSFVVRAQDLPAVDAALRIYVLCSLVEQATPTWRTAWLVRPGVPELHDQDLCWLPGPRAGVRVHSPSLPGLF